MSDADDRYWDPREGLTPAQRALYDRTVWMGGQDGSDLAEVLAGWEAPEADRAAVAQALSGPGTDPSYAATTEAGAWTRMSVQAWIETLIPDPSLAAEDGDGDGL